MIEYHMRWLVGKDGITQAYERIGSFIIWSMILTSTKSRGYSLFCAVQKNGC